MSFHILKFSNSPDNQLIELLKANKIGTPGKSMIYHHLNVEEKLKSIQNPIYVKLAIRDHLIGAVCFSQRIVHKAETSLQAVYIRYFTFKESFRSTGNKERNISGKSIVRQEINELMNGEGLDPDKSYLLYAYVDPRNIRSARIIKEFGLTQISTFSVIVFSRLFPKKSTNAYIAHPDEYVSIQDRLKDYYKEEQLLCFDNLFFKGNYFLLKKGGKVVCGAQGIPEKWIINDMPGLSGFLLIHVVSHIPFINRLFTTSYRFILIEGIFCDPGHKDDLEELFSNMLKHFNVFSALICLDQKSAIYRMVKSLKLGLVNKLQKETPQEVVAKRLDDMPLDKKSPVYISGFDVL